MVARAGKRLHPYRLARVEMAFPFRFSCATAAMCAVIDSTPSSSGSGSFASQMAELIVTTDRGAHWKSVVDPGPDGNC